MIRFALALALMLPASLASAQQVCGKREDVVKGLAEKYSEVVTWRGLADTGLMIEVFSAPEGSFTIITTRPSGFSCFVLAGKGSRAFDPEPIEKGDGT
jgi:aminoglycoside N3'-acetyltransferase